MAQVSPPMHGPTEARDFLLVLNRKHSTAKAAADRIRTHLGAHNIQDHITRVVPIGADRALFNPTPMLENLRLYFNSHFSQDRNGAIAPDKEFKIAIVTDKSSFAQLKEILQLIKNHLKGYMLTGVSVATDADLGPALTTDKIGKLKNFAWLKGVKKFKAREFVNILISNAGKFTKESMEQLKDFAVSKGFPEEKFDTLIKVFIEHFIPCIYKPNIKAHWYSRFINNWADQFFPFIDNFFGLKQNSAAA